MKLKSPFLNLILITALVFLRHTEKSTILLSHAFQHSIHIHSKQSYKKSHSLSHRPNIRLYQAKEALAREGDWAAYLDEENTGLVYYFNSVTGESIWDAPTTSFPKVFLSKRKKEKMMTKTQEYIERQQLLQQQQQEMEENADKGFFGGLLSNISVKDNIFFAGEKISPNSSTQKSSANMSISSNNLNINDFQGPITSGNKLSTTNTESKQLFVADLAKVFKKTPDPLLRKSIDINASSPDLTSPVIKTQIKVEMISRVLPHPMKTSWGGEDAVFTTSRSFGVFDGVSGATKEEGKPLYSVTVAEQLKKSLGKRGGLSIKQLQSELMDASIYADSCATGATTALLASIGTDGFLRVINLGDSVLIVIRNNRILVKTKEKIHYFDCPYQLASGSPDRPRDAISLQVELVPGDIIIAGSDGVFDNLSESTVRKIVNSVSNSKVNLPLVVKKIVEQSRKVSLNPNAQTPYAQMAMKNEYKAYESGLGGKIDDISCIVVQCT